jgi:hypothetical protein
VKDYSLLNKFIPCEYLNFCDVYLFFNVHKIYKTLWNVESLSILKKFVGGGDGNRLEDGITSEIKLRRLKQSTVRSRTKVLGWMRVAYEVIICTGRNERFEMTVSHKA